MTPSDAPQEGRPTPTTLTAASSRLTSEGRPTTPQTEATCPCCGGPQSVASSSLLCDPCRAWRNAGDRAAAGALPPDGHALTKAWREGYAAGALPSVKAQKVLRRLVAWWDRAEVTRYDPELGPIVSEARRLAAAPPEASER
jgi:hypothetical protein